MTDVNVHVTDFDRHTEFDKKVETKEVKSVSFAYDGGRLFVQVNGEDVFVDLGMGHDFDVELTF